MMQKLTNDPAFWAWLWTLLGLLFTAAGALLGLVIAWAKARTAQLEAKTAQLDASAAKDSATAVAVGQSYQQATLVQHTAAIAALQATTQGASVGGSGGGQGAVAPVGPAAAVPPSSVMPGTVEQTQGLGGNSLPPTGAPYRSPLSGG